MDTGILRLLLFSFTSFVAVLFAPLALFFYVFCSTQKPEYPRLYFKGGKRITSIVKRMDILKKKYRPYLLTFVLEPLKIIVPTIEGHLMTFFHEFVREYSGVKFVREHLQTADGGEVSIDIYDGDDDGDDLMVSLDKKCIMIIVHGLVGSSESHYVQNYCHQLISQGICPIVMNARGCGNMKLKSERYFTTHYTEDIRMVVNTVHAKYPNATLLISAYSLGSNLLTKYLGEEGASTPLSGAIAFANPFCWLTISDHLMKPLEKRLYNYLLTRSLVNYLQKHSYAFETVDFHKDQLSELKTLQEYDQKVTLKLWGMESLEKYYVESSGKLFLSKVKIPFLIMNALDDPIIPMEAIDYEGCMANENICLVTTQYGGHVAWMEGNILPDDISWADKVGTEFCKSVYDHVKASREDDVIFESLVDNEAKMLK